MDLSIIIVSWNVRERLRENLRALFQAIGQGRDLSAEVFVIDNNSADGSAEMVRKEFSQVQLITNKENLGFAQANNQALARAQAEFILLLNPDMRVGPDTLANMLTWMRENKQASIAGCHLVDARGRTVKQARRFPSILDQIAIILKLPHLFPGILNKYLRVDFDYSRAARVDSIRGSFFMIRSSFFQAQEKILLDKRYFVWFEEVDFCRRIKKAGGEIWYTPAGQCLDYVGESFKQLPRGQAQKYFRDSMLKYFKKWQPVWQYWILKLAWPVGMFLARAGEKLRFKKKI